MCRLKSVNGDMFRVTREVNDKGFFSPFQDFVWPVVGGLQGFTVSVATNENKLGNLEGLGHVCANCAVS